jgi:hypothetical protein
MTLEQMKALLVGPKYKEFYLDTEFTYMAVCNFEWSLQAIEEVMIE